MKDKVIGIGLVVSLVLGVFGLFGGETVVREVVNNTVGVASGPDHRLGVEYFFDGLADGGGCFSTSTEATGAVNGTLTSAQMQKYNCFYVMNNSATVQEITLPATSTAAGVLPANGMHRSWLIVNATTTAGNTLTIQDGAGINLIGVTANDDVIDGTERSVLDCWRLPNTDWDCRLDELLNVD